MRTFSGQASIARADGGAVRSPHAGRCGTPEVRRTESPWEGHPPVVAQQTGRHRGLPLRMGPGYAHSRGPLLSPQPGRGAGPLGGGPGRHPDCRPAPQPDCQHSTTIRFQSRPRRSVLGRGLHLRADHRDRRQAPLPDRTGAAGVRVRPSEPRRPGVAGAQPIANRSGGLRHGPPAGRSPAERAGRPRAEPQTAGGSFGRRRDRCFRLDDAACGLHPSASRSGRRPTSSHRQPSRLGPSTRLAAAGPGRTGVEIRLGGWQEWNDGTMEWWNIG